jgi:plastocyanin
MLVFCLYAVAAYKGFGRRGALVSVIVIVVFGAIGPSVAPLLAPGFFGRAVAAFVPVMTIFGPATFVSYLWLSRTATERSGAQWLAEQAVRLARPRRTRAVRARVGLALPSCGLAGLVFATIAWSGDTTTTNAASPPLSRETGAGRLISMRNVAFSPASATVKIGQTVTWTNADRAAHNVVATSGATFHSSRFGIGGTFRFRAERPGRITYVCTLHPGMNGTITITR